MHRLQTVLLRHDTRAGPHYDLLLEDGSASPPSAAPLWAARVAHPPQVWSGRRLLHLTPLPPHRRHYLVYQGTLSHGRGHVRRVDQGRSVCRLWSADRIVVEASLRRFRGWLDLRRRSDSLWVACVLACPDKVVLWQ